MCKEAAVLDAAINSSNYSRSQISSTSPDYLQRNKVRCLSRSETKTLNKYSSVTCASLALENKSYLMVKE